MAAVSSETHPSPLNSVRPESTARLIVLSLLVAAAYYGAARLGLLLQLSGTNASPVWPPSGIGLAAVLLFGLRIWPGIMLGAFLANLLTLPLTSAGYMASLGICIGNTLEHVVALLLIRWLIGSDRILERAADVFRFFIAAVVSCAVASTGGVASLWLAGIVPGDIVGAVWFTWWLGDMAGMLVVAPALYLWSQPRQPEMRQRRSGELIALLLTSAVVAELLFGGWVNSLFVSSLPYLVAPVLLWAAFRFSLRETATVVLLISVIAVANIWQLMEKFSDPSAMLVYAPFIGPGLSGNDSLLMLQMFVCALAITGMTLASAVCQQRSAEEAERKLREELEQRVEQRTAELQKSNAALKESNLEIQRFTYAASHDLQTPLRNISACAQFIRDDFQGEMSSTADGYVDGIIGGVERMLRMNAELLEYSQIELRDSSMDPVALNSVFDEVLEKMASADHEMRAKVTRDELPTVIGDSLQLSQLLQNLIANGIKYNKQEQPVVHVSAQRNGAEWRIAVQDNGIGIMQDHQERIFELFRQLHVGSRDSGTGIGLAICRRIINRHGGQLWVESQAGEGSTFFFTVAARD